MATQIRLASGLSLLAAFASAQTFELKDHSGSRVLTVSEVEPFQYKGNLRDGVADLRATVKNVSGENLSAIGLHATVHKKDGSTSEVPISVCDTRWCDFPAGAAYEFASTFGEQRPYTPENFSSVEFSLDSSWVSPRDQRLATEAQARKDATEAAHQKRLLVEGKKKDAELRDKAVTERVRIRAACGEIYKNTADKKLSDLTVREEQQVRLCQALTLYTPQ